MSLPSIPGQEETSPLPPHRFIRRYLTETCTIVYLEPLDAYSEPPTTPRTAVVPCRCDYSRRKVWGADGQEVVANGMFFLPPEAQVGLKDSILFDGRRWTIIEVRF